MPVWYPIVSSEKHKIHLCAFCHYTTLMHVSGCSCINIPCCNILLHLLNGLITIYWSTSQFITSYRYLYTSLTSYSTVFLVGFCNYINQVRYIVLSGGNFESDLLSRLILIISLNKYFLSSYFSVRVMRINIPYPPPPPPPSKRRTLIKIEYSW